MYVLPQEVEVWYIIPSVRKELSRVFVEKHGQTYEKVGNMLGITKAAVSQYLSNKRANKLKLTDDIKKEVEKSADAIMKDPKKSINEVERILALMKEKGITCDICKKFNPGAAEHCDKKSHY